MSEVARRVLVVFVDALGPAQLERFNEKLAFLPYRRSLRGILGYSSGALPTILTGAPPTIHGRMCLFSKRADDSDGVLSPLSILGLLPQALHERDSVRRTAAALLARHSRISGYVALHRVPPEAFRWLDIPERDDIFQTEMIGRARTFLADARATGLRVYAANWKLPEGERWNEAFEFINAHKPDLTFLYASELDAHLHQYGNNEQRTDALILRVARRISRAREMLSEDGQPLVTIIVGDHGMADVDIIVDPRPIISRIGIDRAIVDSTMMRFWGDAATLARARKAIESIGTEGAWLDSYALRKRDVPVAGSPYGQALWLLPEGTIFAPSWVGGKARGMHGYDIGTHSSLAALASDDPAISQCQALVDVASVIRGHLGISHSRRSCA